MAYPTRIDFLKRIDDRLNSLEKPLRARFYWGYVPSDMNRPMSLIHKADIRQKCHLRIQINEKEYRVKFTTVLEKKTIHLRELVPEIYETGETEERAYLKVPLGLNEYKKTWGSCDLILCEWNFPERKRTILYWIDAPLLLGFIERLKEPIEVRVVNSLGEETTSIYTKEDLAMGIDIERDLQHRLKYVRQIDIIDWETCRIHPTDTFFFATSTDRRGLDFTFRGNREMQQAYWPNFKLMPFADQSLPVTITHVESGRETTYPSGVAAVKDFEQRGYQLRPASLSHVLHGRQRTIKTAFGRITARYA